MVEMGKKRKAIEERITRIKKLALTITGEPDDIPNQLFEDIEWLVKNKKDYKIHKLLNSEVLPEEAQDVIEFILKDIGYRHRFSVRLPEKEQLKDMTAIPFAFLIMTIIPTNEYKDFPDTLPSTIMTLIAKEKIIRKAFNLGDFSTILTDPHLYNVNHPAWQSESVVKQYLTYLTDSLQHQPFVVPLFNPSKETKFFEPFSLIKQEESSIILVRAMCCCAVVASDNEDQIEEILFYKEDTENNTHLEDLKSIISQGLKQKGITTLRTKIFSSPLELYDVPYFGYHIHREIQLNMLIESAKDNLMTIAESGKPLHPVVYVFPITNRDELLGFKIEGYTGPDMRAVFFTYDYVISPQFESPDDVTERINRIAAQLNIDRIFVVEPEERF